MELNYFYFLCSLVGGLILLNQCLALLEQLHPP